MAARTERPGRSELFERVASFLPAMQAANEALAMQCADNPASADIEQLDDPDAQHIEMNLACGILEVTKRDSTAASDDSDDSEGLKELQLPSAQTARMSAAQRAGKVLVQEMSPAGSPESQPSDDASALRMPIESPCEGGQNISATLLSQEGTSSRKRRRHS
ncbi:hypothetical protein AB1Y20_023505 [Prymnesium parvum]|uniref:Uncharacterized protein n=1 Tax=Prymnesium parvum TaxID=97485 RepID=A0AB34JGW9_PRYPA